MRRLIPLLLASALAGCASVQGDLAQFRAFKVTDAKAALVTATKGNDRPAMQCLPYILTKLEAQEAAAAEPPPPPPAGGLDALEILRVAIHAPSAGTGALEELDLYCAALRTSIEVDIAKGAIMGAKASAGGAAILPAAMEAARILLNILRRK